MSALDQIKGSKTAIVAVIAAVVVLVAYLFIGQSGHESEPEEVISKRVRLEVVEEPATGQTEDQASLEPQGAVGVPEPEAATDAATAQRPESAVDKPSAVKDAHKAQGAVKPIPSAEDTDEKPSAPTHKALKDELKEPQRSVSEKKVAEKKQTRPAIKEKTEAVDAVKDEKETKEVVKKQPKKSPKPAKAVTAKDIAARPWAVGLASFKTLGEAQEVTGSLKALHHNAYITETVKDGRKWYRVRVGFYATREDAEKVGNSLSARFGLKDLWVVKPARAEAKAHFK